VSELASIYSALIMNDNEVTIIKDKINTFIKVSDINVETFLPGLFSKALANVSLGNLTCNVKAGELSSTVNTTSAGGLIPTPPLLS
jgi:large subunit ribosomal protein LP1